jgi:transcriptional regulator of acetoin/glycerol metabolism
MLNSVQTARSVYFGQGKLPADQLAHSILRSWMRCSDMGLDQAAPAPAEAASAAEMRGLQERHDALRRLCRPELDALHAEARETGGIVILTNPEGVVLDAVGDPTFAGRAAQVALRPGAAWVEGAAGTNAIGTALAERRPVSVHGGEHFFNVHQDLTCAAAPIFDGRGAVMGVLDLSGHAAVSHMHALGLVKLAVEQIEHRLFQRPFAGCTVLRFHSDAALLGASRQGVLIFDEGRLVAANRRGLGLTGRNWDDLDETRFEDLFDADLARLDDQTELKTATGETFFGAIDRSGLESARPSTPAAPVGETLRDTELAAMRVALDACKGNVSKAARKLGVHRATLYRRLLSAC